MGRTKSILTSQGAGAPRTSSGENDTGLQRNNQSVQTIQKISIFDALCETMPDTIMYVWGHPPYASVPRVVAHDKTTVRYDKATFMAFKSAERQELLHRPLKHDWSWGL